MKIIATVITVILTIALLAFIENYRFKPDAFEIEASVLRSEAAALRAEAIVLEMEVSIQTEARILMNQGSDYQAKKLIQNIIPLKSKASALRNEARLLRDRAKAHNLKTEQARKWWKWWCEKPDKHENDDVKEGKSRIIHHAFYPKI